MTAPGNPMKHPTAAPARPVRRTDHHPEGYPPTSPARPRHRAGCALCWWGDQTDIIAGLARSHPAAANAPRTQAHRKMHSSLHSSSQAALPESFDSKASQRLLPCMACRGSAVRIRLAPSCQTPCAARGLFVGQGVAAKPGGAKKRKIKRKTETSNGPPPGAIGMAAAAQARDRAMALHCSSSWLIRASSSGKFGNSPRSIPESAMAV